MLVYTMPAWFPAALLLVVASQAATLIAPAPRYSARAQAALASTGKQDMYIHVHLSQHNHSGLMKTTRLFCTGLTLLASSSGRGFKPGSRPTAPTTQIAALCRQCLSRTERKMAGQLCLCAAQRVRGRKLAK
jgi:hypothetical protein